MSESKLQSAKAQFEKVCHDLPSAKRKSAGEKHKDRLTWLRERANEAVQIHNDLGDAFEAGVKAAHEEGFRDGLAEGDRRGREMADTTRSHWDRFWVGLAAGVAIVGAAVFLAWGMTGGPL